VTKPAPDAPFTLKRVQEMLGLSRTVVNGLISQGFVAPARGARNEHRFSFQDLMLLRTAHALQRANIPPRKILRSLAKLKADLPPELPLTGLRITAVGADVAVRDRSGQWHADSGQLLMDFEVAEVSGTVSFIQRPGVPSRTSVPAATDWFKRGEALEASDAAAAEEAYLRAIEAEPAQVGAYLNLGAMLCDAHRCDEAVELYEQAVAKVPGDPFLHFNHAIALEDQERPDDALAAYGRALALDGNFADAHYNSAVLLERSGDAQGALRHFAAYRRLARSDDVNSPN
jgi:tetratricopeptide (TPR) repeat protein